MTKESEYMPIYCTMRDGNDEIDLLCRFPDGQKYDAVSVHIDNPNLAENIMAFINNWNNSSQKKVKALNALHYIQHDWKQDDGRAVFNEQCEEIRNYLQGEK